MKPVAETIASLGTQISMHTVCSVVDPFLIASGRMVNDIRNGGCRLLGPPAVGCRPSFPKTR
jgi:hypothetical protein